MTTKKAPQTHGELSAKLMELAKNVTALEADVATIRRRDAVHTVLLASAVEMLEVFIASIVNRGGYAKGSPLDKAVRQSEGIISTYRKAPY